jgi:hypothetical protein
MLQMGCTWDKREYDNMQDAKSARHNEDQSPETGRCHHYFVVPCRYALDATSFYDGPSVGTNLMHSRLCAVTGCEQHLQNLCVAGMPVGLIGDSSALPPAITPLPRLNGR